MPIYGPTSGGSGSFGDTVLCAAPTGVAATDNANFQAGLTAAAGGTLQLRNGNYNLTTAMTIASFTRIVADKATNVNCNVAGVVFSIVSKTSVRFEGVYFNLTNASSTLFQLDGSFGCTWENCFIFGTHTLGSPKPNQIGIDMINNSGDCWFYGNSQLGNLGKGVQSASFALYLDGSKVTNCQYGVYLTTSFASGIIIDSCTFASTVGGTTISQVYSPSSCGYVLISSSDLEGATNTIQVGDGSMFGGPTALVVTDSHLAGTTKILDIESSYATTLTGVSFTADPTTTPTTLTINATGAPDNGYAMGLTTNVAADSNTISPALFPSAWTYFGRTASKLIAPVITGNGTAVTQTASDYSTKLATTAYVDSAIAKRSRNQSWMPTGAISETYPRDNRDDVVNVISTGMLGLYGGVLVPANTTVTNITFVSSSTAANTPTNWWFCLVDQALNVLRTTADQTTTPWLANTVKTLALSSTYTPTVDTPVYLGVMVKATAVPSFVGSVVSAAGTAHTSITPKLGGQSSTGLTTPASLGATAGAITAGDLVWAYIS